MATASDLKVKATKILTIIENIEEEQINCIEKDILLQEVRELYSDILLTRAENSESAVAKEPAVERQNIAEPQPVKEDVKAEPPAVAIPFDAGDFDLHDLLDVSKEAGKAAMVAEVVSAIDEPVSSVAETVETADVETPELVEQEQEEPVGQEIIEEEKSDLDEPAGNYFESEGSVSADFNEEDDADDDLADEDEPIDELEENEDESEFFDPEESVEQNEDEISEPENMDLQPADEKTVAETPSTVEPAEVHDNAIEAEDHDKSDHVVTLGEQLGQSRQSSLNDRFASNAPAEGSFGLKPISDIKSAIPLGERFRFTRMLFSGNGAAFESTVAALNEMSSIDEADAHVREHFSWDMDSPVVADFMNIVRRRYL